MESKWLLAAGIGTVAGALLLRRLKAGAAALATFDVTYCETVRATITVKNTGTKTLHLKWTVRYTGPATKTTGWYDVGTVEPGQTVTAPVDNTHIVSKTVFPLGTYNAEAVLADFDTEAVYDTKTITGAFRVIEIAKAEITSFSVVKV